MQWEFHHAQPRTGSEVIALRNAVRRRLFDPQTRKREIKHEQPPKPETRAVGPCEPQAWLTEEPFEHVRAFYAATGKARGVRQYLDRRLAEIGMTFEQMTKGGRNQHVVMTRQLMCYELREHFSLSWPAIAKAVGLADHTTPLWSYRKIERMKADGTFADVYGDGKRRYKLTENDLSIMKQIREFGQAGTAKIQGHSVKTRLYCLRRNGIIYLAEGNPRYLWSLTSEGMRALEDRGL